MRVFSCPLDWLSACLVVYCMLNFRTSSSFKVPSFVSLSHRFSLTLSVDPSFLWSSCPPSFCFLALCFVCFCVFIFFSSRPPLTPSSSSSSLPSPFFFSFLPSLPSSPPFPSPFFLSSHFVFSSLSCLVSSPVMALTLVDQVLYTGRAVSGGFLSIVCFACKRRSL